MSTVFALPENVANRKTISRCWNGVTVEQHEYTCTGRILFQIERDDESGRLSAQLEEVGRDHVEARTAPATPNPHPYKPRPLFYAPAGMDVWAHSADSRYIRCGTLRFDAETLQQRLGVSPPAGRMDVPRLRFSDDRLWTLIRLLADAIDEADPAAQLYGDSLTAAVAATLFERPRERKGGGPGLSAIQLRDAISYLEAKMPEKVELSTLAELAGLSQSHYSRAFKASTGLAPYQWQLQARVERAKDLLLNTNGCLEVVAEATGFADAVHFGRTFRKMTGATPAAWRMDRLT
ncbi:MAG: AraC family transcriptional regulator [Ramlibacter sp.]|jgi:AraC-like DNA-binding protein|nr:AraC family transcriptional regulator [Ramlibacter sp.]